MGRTPRVVPLPFYSGGSPADHTFERLRDPRSPGASEPRYARAETRSLTASVEAMCFGMPSCLGSKPRANPTS